MPAPLWRLTVETIRRLALPRHRQELGLFSLEGFRSIERALRNQAPIQDVVVSERFAASSAVRNTRILADVAVRGLPLHIAPDAVIDELTQGRGLGDVFATLRMPPAADWDDFCAPQGRSLVLVGWNLVDPGNTGAVIRSALAAGARGFVAVGTTDPWHPKSVRTSMGSLFALPIRRVEDDEGWIDALHGLGFETFATVCRDAEVLPDVRLRSERIALVLGSEAFGLSDAVAARMRRRVTIPMPEGVDSYSINAAAAVLAYTLLRAGPIAEEG
jgi:TrmH family RNA methyltransferase